MITSIVNIRNQHIETNMRANVVNLSERSALFFAYSIFSSSVMSLYFFFIPSHPLSRFLRLTLSFSNSANNPNHQTIHLILACFVQERRHEFDVFKGVICKLDSDFSVTYCCQFNHLIS